MECPLRPRGAVDAVAGAIKRCPFLRQLAADNGEAYTNAFVLDPRRPAGREPIFPEALSDLAASFQLFHGAGGVVPLVRVAPPAPVATPAPESPQSVPAEARACRPEAGKPEPRRAAARPLAAAPFASVTSGVFKFLPGPDDFLAQLRQRRRDRADRRAQRQRPRPDRPVSRARPRPRPQQHRLERWRSHPVVGGLIPLSAAGDYVCPPLVVAGRQAVARLKAVRLLRPRSLPVKLLGVGGHCLAANVPAGMAREHTEKLSPAWFLAVHATVPFFAFVRKGVGMPPWALALTVAAAVVGQALGARLERRRLEWVAQARAAGDGRQASGGGGGGQQPSSCAAAFGAAGQAWAAAPGALPGSPEARLPGLGSVSLAA